MAQTKGSKDGALNGWVADEIGYQRTASLTIISNVLKNLIDKRRFINLRQKGGYQSGNTILISFDASQLAIDKPMDWPGSTNKVTLAFRDEQMLLNYCTVGVRATTDDTLFTEFPSELYQLQRRSHYRVDVPRASRVALTLKGENLPGYYLNDISANGILISRREEIILARDDQVRNITMVIPPDEPPIGNPEDDETLIFIKEGQVKRTFLNRRLHLAYAGIYFPVDGKEEEMLLRYVRRRELELLRR